jgi:hypothetical protein
MIFHFDDTGAGARVVVRSTFLKLNLKRKWEGELESMQSERYFQIAHEGWVMCVCVCVGRCRCSCVCLSAHRTHSEI